MEFLLFLFHRVLKDQVDQENYALNYYLFTESNLLYLWVLMSQPEQV